jgi:LysR family transcriptional regulator, benzoate and cis,cis-muconate-responsive activator of ben and cat genes
MWWSPDTVGAMEARELQYFVAVAEELRPGLPLPRWPDLDGSYPDGPGPQVRDNVQLLQLIALGRASAVLPESVREHLGDDLATVPIVDASSVTTVIAWPPHSRSRAVAGVVRAATRL